MKIFWCLLIIFAVNGVNCEAAALPEDAAEISQIQDDDNLTEDENIFSYSDESGSWLNIEPADSLYREYANPEIMLYEDPNYVGKVDDSGPEEAVKEPAALYEVEYSIPKLDDTLIYDFDQINNANTELGGFSYEETKNKILFSNDYSNGHLNFESNDFLKVSEDEFPSIPGVNQYDAKSDNQYSIMTILDRLRSQMSELRIVELRRESIVLAPSTYGIDTFKQKMENVFNPDRNDISMESNSNRGAMLFLGVLLMGLGTVFMVLLCRLKAYHKRMRAHMGKMPPYQPMPAEEI